MRGEAQHPFAVPQRFVNIHLSHAGLSDREEKRREEKYTSPARFPRVVRVNDHCLARGGRLNVLPVICYLYIGYMYRLASPDSSTVLVARITATSLDQEACFGSGLRGSHNM